ncbi:MAG: single-stranded DNA-binding protein [Anaerolineae bacterium]
MYHKIILVGNLGRDPEMRYTPDGTPVTNFSVATNRRWTGQDGQQHEETIWFRVTTWRKQAELCNQYLGKGQRVLIEGRLRPDSETGGPRIWVGNDGKPRASFELDALSIRFLGGPRGAAEGAPSPLEEEPPPDIMENEIPF